MANRRRNRGADTKNYLCQYQYCDKAFFRKDHLVRHQRQKHGKPFGADSQIVYYCYYEGCGKTFYKMSALERHLSASHSNGNDYWIITVVLTVTSAVLRHCWLGSKKSIWPIKIEWWGAGVVICVKWSANDLHMVQLMPLPLIITHLLH